MNVMTRIGINAEATTHTLTRIVNILEPLNCLNKTSKFGEPAGMEIIESTTR